MWTFMFNLALIGPFGLFVDIYKILAEKLIT